MKKSIYILLCILLSACAATMPAPSATPKVINTATAEASSTPTVTIQSSSIPKQTSTPAPTPVPVQPSYNLPNWMTKPNTNIVATITDQEDDIFQFAFFGENIDKKYEMTIPENLTGYFWQNSTHFGFLDHNTVYILDLQTGKTSSQTIPSESLRFIEDPTVPDIPKALFVSKPVSEGQDFFFVFADYRDQFSNDWQYRVHRKDYVSAEGNIIVENINTGETYAVTNPKDHLWDVNFKWSNNIPAQLAILQSKFFPEGRVHGDQITVVNPSTKKAIGVYIDDYAYDFEWSPDDKKFLFKEYDRGVPCIYYREENKHQCVYGMSPKGGGVFRWSQDQKNILFEYYVHNSSNGDSFSGNFCQFNLENGATICPTKDIDELKHNAIKDYQISPDGRYVILQLECSPLGTDFACNPIHALMSLDGENFRILDENYYENIGYIGTEELLWRPIP